MNKSAIKNFAVTARIKLMEAIQQKAYELGITKIEIKEPEVYQDGFRINNKFFKSYQMKQRKKLLEKIKGQGYDQVIEEVSYTWFNRFIAIRFMEVNDYLPIGVRVLSALDKRKIEPDAVTDVLAIAEALDLDLNIVYRLQDENNNEELFKYILVKQCNKLGEIMPMMFEQIEDYTELLLPDKLLLDGSVLRDLISMIDEDDWKEQVEIIGWLYQFYISEKKDEVFADLKKNKKITKENIPAATQLFTPKWIVQYMVENSLGRLWLESHSDANLQKQWKYYLVEAKQEQIVKEKLDRLRHENLSPEEITILDPCMGSGHILVYAFDVFYQIYMNSGYSTRDIPELILNNNLFGLDIDDRAAQLAYFAVMMKARSYDRRIFRKQIKLNLWSIQESNGIPQEAIDYLVSPNSLELEQLLREEEVRYLVDVFYDAKEFGSILKLKSIDIDAIEERVEEIKNGDTGDLFESQFRDIILEKIPPLINQARLLSKKYDVVITNPPYVGRSGMNNNLIQYAEDNYRLYKNDLFAIFIKKCMDLTKENCFTSLITMHSWMFLSSYKEAREDILHHTTIDNLLHLGMEAFEEINSKVIQTVAFSLRKKRIDNYYPKCIRLVDYYYTKKKEKSIQFFNLENHYSSIKQSDFYKIPGYPIAYWVSNEILKLFANVKLSEKYKMKVGLQTPNNEIFLRYWYEINYNTIGFNFKNTSDAKNSGYHWFPYNKGGNFRKWYGNMEYMVKKQAIQEHPLYFKKSISWTRVTSFKPSFRQYDTGFVFDNSGPSIFPESENFLVTLGILNSKVTEQIIGLLNPTLNLQVGNIGDLPEIIFDENNKKHITQNVVNAINISKIDWDAHETSWNFKKHYLVQNGSSFTKFKNAFDQWEKTSNENYYNLKKSEEEINIVILNQLNLNGQIPYEISDEEITVRKANLNKDIKSFISYAIGCMFGRYSLDQDGLVFAGGEFDHSKYQTFKADADNIIPITDDEYFEDDIVHRFIDFVRVNFGKDSLEENLDFIADSLTKKSKETSRQRIRRYLVKEFYKDHVQTYQKRPLYWLFDSGKNDGFKALIYMHRYQVSTVASVRTDYLHTLQRKYEAEMARLDLLLESDLSLQEKTNAKKQKEKIQKQLIECQQYDQVIAHIANQKIEMDLDEGVKGNYDKFQNIEVPQGEGKKALKANLLAKI